MTFYVFAVFNVDTFGKEEDFLSFFRPRIQMGNFNGKAQIDEIGANKEDGWNIYWWKFFHCYYLLLNYG